MVASHASGMAGSKVCVVKKFNSYFHRTISSELPVNFASFMLPAQQQQQHERRSSTLMNLLVTSMPYRKGSTFLQLENSIHRGAGLRCLRLDLVLSLSVPNSGQCPIKRLVFLCETLGALGVFRSPF